MIEHDDDLRYEIDRVVERLDEMQRQQRLANSRIRQEIVGLGAFVASLVVVAAILYNEWPSWLIAVLYAIGGPAYQAWLVSKVQKQEEL